MDMYTKILFNNLSQGRYGKETSKNQMENKQKIIS